MTLTFDNGPDPQATPRVLDVLHERAIKATFFVVGEQLRAHRELAARAHADGHWIGNHTLTHPRPLGGVGTGAGHEIAATQEALGELAHPDRLFRPSGEGGDLEPGLLSAPAVEALVAGGYTCVLWNAVPGDWKDPDGWVETALRQVAQHDWTLLVLHDVAGAAAPRLDEFLDRVDAEFHQDFPPACVPIRRGACVVQHWHLTECAARDDRGDGRPEAARPERPARSSSGRRRAAGAGASTLALGRAVTVDRGDERRHRLVVIGDSLTHGFQSGAIFNTDLSYAAIIARELGWDGFRFPRYGGPGGIPLNIEYILRDLEQRFGAEI